MKGFGLSGRSYPGDIVVTRKVSNQPLRKMQLLFHGPFNFRRQICQDEKVCYQMTFHKLFDFTYEADDEA